MTMSYYNRASRSKGGHSDNENDTKDGIGILKSDHNI